MFVVNQIRVYIWYKDYAMTSLILDFDFTKASTNGKEYIHPIMCRYDPEYYSKVNF